MDLLNSIIEFFNHPFFIILGGITALLSIFIFIKSIIIIVTGVAPVWIRLGKGLSNRKIAVFAESDFQNLKSTLVDSGIFKEKNVIQIVQENIAKSERESIMLVNYSEFKEDIREILKFKKDADALIIYAPHKKGRIDESILEEIELYRNVMIVNFRGRLLNDILTTMITTTNEKR